MIVCYFNFLGMQSFYQLLIKHNGNILFIGNLLFANFIHFHAKWGVFIKFEARLKCLFISILGFCPPVIAKMI